MPRKLNAASRRTLAAEAYAMAARRQDYTAIGAILGLTRQTVSKLVKEEIERRAGDRQGTEREEAIAGYAAVIRYGWSLLESDALKANSLNQSGIMNSIVAALKAIDEITGVKAPARSENRSDFHFHDDSRSLEDYFAELDEFRAGHGETGVAEPLDSTTTNS